MSIITIDFETFYDKDFSLSKMTTEEYINDPRFEVIGMGFKVDDGKTWWVTGNDIEATLNSFTWADHAVLCHNTLFDGAILAWHYGIKPGFWLDTLSMARALHGVDAGGSLKALAERYNIGVKGDEVINALGKRRVDFTAGDLDRYGAYCRNDVDLTYRLLHKLQPFPDNEFKLIDLTLRMFTEPSLTVDGELLHGRLESLLQDKSIMLAGLMSKLGCLSEEEVRSKLASNKQFAAVLESFGVQPPMKISAATGKETYALAKTDQGFIDLQEHPNEMVQELCAVRLGTKSTIEESRVTRFIDIGKRNRGRIPIPLKYYGAHTGRWSGLDAVNFQNLPSRDKQKKALKNSITAPDGSYVVNCDSSQIEARVLAWLAGQEDVVEAFAQKRDIYCEDATKAYGRPITKADVMERFVGKTMRLGLGYGTGAVKLHSVLKLGGADITEERCKELVSIWRQNNPQIVALWREADRVLEALLSWPVDEDGVSVESIEFGAVGNGCVTVDRTGIKLPNGLYIRYPGIRRDGDQILYTSRKGPVKLWGGVVVENVVQALARIVVGEQMLALHDGGYRPVLTVHDAAVCIVPKDKIETGLKFITDTMATAPIWAPGLPVACEAKYGASYGDC